jgi:hypothetical protein
LKIIKKSDNNMVNSAKIGAVTIMPYFAVQESGISAIDSNRFMSKTKAALAYYENEMDELDSMYYIYDKAGSVPYENNEGGKAQKNDAHIVEFIAATSIIDFTNKAINEFSETTDYHEFGIKKDEMSVDIRHFFENTKNTILKPLTAFAYATKTYLEFIPNNMGEAFARELNLKNEINTNEFYVNLTEFTNEHFKKWLLELERNNRTFKPFNLSGDYNSFVVGRQIETGLFKKGINNVYINQCIGIIENELQKTVPENEKRFLLTLNKITEKYFEKLVDLPTIA